MSGLVCACAVEVNAQYFSGGMATDITHSFPSLTARHPAED